MIDWTINVGHIITFALAGLGMVWAMKSDVRSLNERFDAMDKRMDGLEGNSDKIAEAMKTLAVQAERLNNMDRRLDEMRHGRGFVLDALPNAVKAG